MSSNFHPVQVLRLLTDPELIRDYRRLLKATTQEALLYLNATIPEESVNEIVVLVRDELGIVLKAVDVQTILSLDPRNKGEILSNGMVDTGSKEAALDAVCTFIVGCKNPSQKDLEGSGFTVNQFRAAVQTQAQSLGFVLQTEGR